MQKRVGIVIKALFLIALTINFTVAVAAQDLATVTANGAVTDDAVRIDNNGDEQTRIGKALYVNGNQLDRNVGIATNTPLDRLHVNGGAIRVEQNAPKIRLFEKDTIDQNWQFRIVDGTLQFQIANDLFDSTTNRLVITQAGLVGIGTNSPTQTLDVKGQARIRQTTQDDTLDEILVQDSDGTIKYRDAATLGAGQDGISCWDLNENGACDLGTEDINLDLACDVLDCAGADGQDGLDGQDGVACWDLNENDACDLATEDINLDLNCDVLDCAGADGQDGTNGLDGADGISCWDLNENNACDLGTEDINLDLACDVLDCAGADGQDGLDGADGIDGINGTDGFSCWDLNMNFVCDHVLEDINLDSMCTVEDCRGADGQDGADGINGTDGALGPQGPPGIDGLNGTDGAQGPPGVDGINGTNGLDGQDGADGIDGINGTDGFSCWDLNENNACDLGTEDINLDLACTTLDCIGPQGIPGQGGTNGTNGIDGINGTNGIDGINGTNGVDGINGTDGINGSQGPPGPTLGIFDSLGLNSTGPLPPGDAGNRDLFNLGNVGIGTATPSARLDVQGGAVLFNGTTGGTPTSGTGTRFMWIPAKSSLRAGFADTGHWDDSLIGDISIGLGRNARGEGAVSVAIGDASWASGPETIAIGGVKVSGTHSVGIGLQDSSGEILGEHVFSVLGGPTGLGTGTPTETLDVDGKARIRNTTQDNALTQIIVQDANGVLHFRDVSTISNTDGDWNVTATETILGNAETNVGLGTDNPTAKLHVVGNANVTGQLSVGTGTVVINESGILFDDGTFQDTAAPDDHSLDNVAGNVTDVVFVNDASQVIIQGPSNSPSPKLVTRGRVFSISNGSDEVPAGFRALTYRGSGFPAGRFVGVAFEGTEDNPLPVTAGTQLARFSGRGFDGVGTSGDNVRIVAVAEEDFTPSAKGTRIEFQNTGLGETSRTRNMVIKASGNVGIGTSNPDAKLDVEVGTGGAATIGDSQNIAVGDYAVAMGTNSVANGFASVAMGAVTTANGDRAIAMGDDTDANGDASVAMGTRSQATGQSAVAMGQDTIASGLEATAMGKETNAEGDSSTATGFRSHATGFAATATGDTTQATGSGSIAMGFGTRATSNNAVAMGENTTAANGQAVAMGSFSNATGFVALATGSETAATGGGATTFGEKTEASGGNSIAAGFESVASGYASVALGFEAEASGDNTFVYGQQARATQGGAIALGQNVTASNFNAIATGFSTIASGNQAFAIGEKTISQGQRAFAQGLETQATGSNAVALGDLSIASGLNSIAAGDQPVASGNAAVAIGQQVQATNTAAFAAGGFSTASGQNSVAIGESVNANADFATALGRDMTVTGTNSFGIGLGNAPKTITQDDTFAVVGGLVGLGTVEPTEQLDVEGQARIRTINQDDTLNMVLVKNASGVLHFRDATTIGGDDGDWNVSGNNIIQSNLEGNVGVGTNNPQAKLDVKTDFGEGGILSGGGSVGGILTSTATGDFSISLGDTTTASGYGSVAFGRETVSTDTGSFAAGQFNNASGVSSVALGGNVVASGHTAVAIGNGVVSSGTNSIALGAATTASGSASTAMGANTVASGDSSTALGGNTDATGINSISMGAGTEASGSTSTAMGFDTTASGPVTTAMGRDITVSGSNSVGIGLDNTPRTLSSANTMAIVGGNVGIGTVAPNKQLDVDGEARIRNITQDDTQNMVIVKDANGVLHFRDANTLQDSDWNVSGNNIIQGNQEGFIGVGTNNPGVKLDVEVPLQTGIGGVAAIGTSFTTATGDFAVAMGSSATATGTNSFAFGASDATNTGAFAVGSSATASGFRSTAIGQDSLADSDHAIAIGRQTRAQANHATALGFLTFATGQDSTAMGHNTVASGTRSFAVGDRANAVGANSVAMGFFSNATSSSAVAMGDRSVASGNAAFAMGLTAKAQGAQSIAIGDHADAQGAQSTAIGEHVQAIGDISTALGSDIRVTGQNSFGIGLDQTVRFLSQDNAMAIVGGVVGLNTTSPTEVLDVDGKARIRNIEQDDTQNMVVVKDANGVLHFRDANTLSDTDWNVTATTTILGNAETNVGLGTDTPDTQLDIDAGSSDSILTLQSNQTSSEAALHAKTGIYNAKFGVENGQAKLEALGFTSMALETQGNQIIEVKQNGITKLNINPFSEYISMPVSNVSIGAGIPDSQLTVRDNGNTEIQVQDSTDSNRGLILRSGTVGLAAEITTNSGAKELKLGVDDFDAITINSALDVGVGTDTPQARLDVRSSGDTVINVLDISDSNRGLVLKSGDVGNSAIITTNSGVKELAFGVDGNNHMHIDNTGNVGIGTPNPTTGLDVVGQAGTSSEFYPLKVRGPNILAGMTFENSGSTGLEESIYSQSDFMIFQTQGQGRMTIRESGNIGIGTTNPVEKLQVIGDVKANEYRFNGPAIARLISVAGGSCPAGSVQIAQEGSAVLCFDGG